MLRNFVREFENALSNHMCNSLVNWFESVPNALPDDGPTGQQKVIGGVQTVEVNRVTRNDKQLWLPEDSEFYKPLQKVKFKMLDEYLKEFPYAYRGNKKLITPESKIQRTNPLGGGFHNFHSEVSNWEDCARALVWTIYLNNIPEGEGETEFLYEKIRIQPRQGLGCVFPSAWMYQHRGNPIHTHSKYIATGWYWFPEEYEGSPSRGFQIAPGRGNRLFAS